MIKLFFSAFMMIGIISCNNSTPDVVDKRIPLRTDTINVVKLSDTLVIYESTCRGCEYEVSTNFAISDSMNIVKLAHVITTDNNSVEMNGGSIRKDLVLVPVKTGVTNMKLYKFWAKEKTAKDSARFTSFKIEVRQ